MPEILINVINKIPQLSGDIRQITADNSDYTIRFVFDDQWEDSPKTVFFVREGGFAYPFGITENDEAAVPTVTGVHIRTYLFVGVQQGDVKTSRPCMIPVYNAITDMIDDSAVQPETTMWEGIVQRIMELEMAKLSPAAADAGMTKPVGVTEVGQLMTAPDVFWAEYDVTTYAEVRAAVDAGKLCMLMHAGRVHRMTSYPVGGNTDYVFVGMNIYLSIAAYRLADDDTWSSTHYKGLTQYDKSNKIDKDDLTGMIPTDRAVYDAILKYATGGTGGGASLDVTAEAGQTIRVTEVDEDGKPTAWESADYQPRTHWTEVNSEPVVIYSAAGVVIDETDGMAILTTPITGIAAGDGCIVNWNGTEYSTTAQTIPAESSMSGIVLGDIGALEGVSTTGEPFVIVIYDTPPVEGMYGAIVPLDGSATVDLAISTLGSKTVHRLPNKYLDLHWMPTATPVMLTSEDVVGQGLGNGVALTGSAAINAHIGDYADGAEILLVVDGESHKLTLGGSGDDGFGAYVDPVVSDGSLVSARIIIWYGGSVTGMQFNDTNTHHVEVYGYSYNAIPPGFTNHLQYLRTPLMSYVAGQYVRITGEDGTVEGRDTDTTLSYSGEIADAKAVGDALRDRYTKTEIDTIMGSYVTDIANLIGGEAIADS